MNYMIPYFKLHSNHALTFMTKKIGEGANFARVILVCQTCGSVVYEWIDDGADPT